MNFFFRQPTPEELLKRWKSKISEEQRAIQRQVRQIESEERKVTQSLTQLAKKLHSKASTGAVATAAAAAAASSSSSSQTAIATATPSKADLISMKLLAREITKSRKAKNRLLAAKTQMGSILLQLKEHIATSKMSGIIGRSAVIMKGVNSIARLGALSKTMQEFSQEMMKAGIMEEMLQDAIEMGEESDIEEEADSEVNAVLFDLTKGLLGQAADVPSNNLQEAETETEDVDSAIQERLKRLLET